jgi:arginase
MVHRDLDVLDKTLRKVNGYESTGSLSESDANACLALVPKVSLVVCSFDPNLGSGDEIVTVAVKASCTFPQSLIDNNSSPGG